MHRYFTQPVIKTIKALGIVCNTLIVILIPIYKTQAQSVRILDSSHKTVSFRGMSVAPDGTVWVSGSRGTIGKSSDNGNSWTWLKPAGMEGRDFRDVEGWDSQTAVIMAVDSPGIILKTRDGGLSWQESYRCTVSGIFLDAMVFDGETGYCLGDPIGGRFWLLRSVDSGTSWELLPEDKRPPALEGEACFAASGTNLIMTRRGKNSYPAFISGGIVTRLHKLKINDLENISLPLLQGQSTTGANTVISYKKWTLVAGGNFGKPDRSDSILAIRKGHSGPFYQPAAMPPGYISCMAAGEQMILACGTTGVFRARLQQKNGRLDIGKWEQISARPFHTIRFSPGVKRFFLAGPGGRVAVWHTEKKLR